MEIRNTICMCLRKFDKSVLPVDYLLQKKAWTTGEIMDTVLTKLKRHLSRDNRSILLMMDNAGCHPEALDSKFSNIKICFLPANTTSKLQQLDLGVIKNLRSTIGTCSRGTCYIR